MNSFDMKIKTSNPKAIGGFFEAETLPLPEGNCFHPQAIAVTSGRACLRQMIKFTQAKVLYVPFYSCNSLLSGIDTLGIQLRFYALDEKLAPLHLPDLKSDEFLLYVNYFGLQTETVRQLTDHYGNQLILDNTQAFFERDNQQCWAFNSARKFFGVPDGAYLYAPTALAQPLHRPENLITDHLTKRAAGELELAYSLFQQNEARINADWLTMSYYSENVLTRLDYVTIQAVRQSNFEIYHQAFASINKLSFPAESLKSLNITPFCYPLWLDFPIDKAQLYHQNIFIPTLWQDVLDREQPGFALEKSLSRNLLCLPLDHRYNHFDCQIVIEAIQKLLPLTAGNTRGIQTC